MIQGLHSLALLSFLISSVFLGGCLTTPESSESLSFVQVYLTDTEQAAIASNRFALDMYRELESKDENLFFSPWSLNTALTMTYEGARGKTADEMHSVLHLSANDSARQQSFSSLDQRFNANDSGYKLSTASALWVDDGFPILGEYERMLDRIYRARASNLDFRGASEEARNTINLWVENETSEKIKELIPPRYVDSSTRLVLTSAIYFNGTWLKAFDRSLTMDEDFYTGDGMTIAVPMMRQLHEEAEFHYLETRDMQMLQMPYTGENLSLTILLPKTHDIAPLESSLTIEKLAQWRAGLVRQRVDIYIPRFKLDANYFLKEKLTDLGMPTAFAGADFSGISPGRELFITEVIHQAYVDINEEGTEAAAATAVAMKKSVSAAPIGDIPEFRADHPFIFMILDEETGCILFLGKVSDPGKS